MRVWRGDLPPPECRFVECPFRTYARKTPTTFALHAATLLRRMLMFYVIHALDKPGQAQTRLDNYADHKSYFSNANIKTVVSGPLLDDDDETKIGSFFLIEAERKKDVIEFNANDPFARIGLWQSVCIHAFNKRVDNRDDSGASS
jgi:uncharacterized protein YciI